MIEILNFQEMRNSSVLGMFSVYIPSFRLTIHRFRIIRTKTGKLILGYPSFKSEQAGASGRPLFCPLFEFSKEKGLEFEQKVLEGLKPFLGLNS